jgi:hypothetical protein
LSTTENDQFIKTVAQLGLTYIGQDGHHHLRFRHANGQEMSASFTPSDWRSRRNELARAERIAGRKLPRQRSGSYRFKPAQTLDTNRTYRERVTGQSVDEMLAEATELRERFDLLTAYPLAESVDEARAVLRRYNDLRQVLARKHRIIGPITEIGT